MLMTATAARSNMPMRLGRDSKAKTINSHAHKVTLMASHKSYLQLQGRCARLDPVCEVMAQLVAYGLGGRRGGA